MKLLSAQIGSIYRINDILLDKKVRHRLQILGMTRNTEIVLLNKKYSGTVIIKVRGTRFALGRKYAQGITLKV